MYIKKLILLLRGCCGIGGAVGQEVGKMTLEEAIEIAYTKSPQAQMAELTFMSRYWSFRSYKAQLLPSLNLNGELGRYNRSLVEVRDPENGRINYVANNTLNNTLSLRINQNIAFTGGVISLYTSLDLFSIQNIDQNNHDLPIPNDLSKCQSPMENSMDRNKHLHHIL